MKFILGLVLILTMCVVICKSQMPADNSKIDWCDVKLCPKKGPHIACKNSKKFVCENASFMPMTPACQKAILDAHNKCRHLTAGGKMNDDLPTAARMTLMQQDTMLAFLASLNLLQCSMTHDICRNTGIYKTSGQNMGIEYTSLAMETIDCVSFVQRRIESWCNETTNLTPKVVSSYKGQSNSNLPGYGHASIMLRDNGVHFGCNVAQFPTYSNGRKSNATQITCNYAVTNMVGSPLYSEGKPASGCVTGKDKTYNHLCHINENKIFNSTG